MIYQITGSGTVSVDLSAIENRTEQCVTFTFTPTATTTLNFVPDGLPGQIYVIRFVTSGTTSYTTTFGSNAKSTATLASGTTDAKVFTVTFPSVGSGIVEMCRTAAQ